MNCIICRNFASQLFRMIFIIIIVNLLQKWFFSLLGKHCIFNVTMFPMIFAAFCDRCHQGGEISQLLLCTRCSCHYHSYCCSPPVRITETVRVGWECMQCKSCQFCRYSKCLPNLIITSVLCRQGSHGHTVHTMSQALVLRIKSYQLFCKHLTMSTILA